MRHQPVTTAASAVGRWGVIALGFSIPISVALDNVLLALIALAWLATGDFREKFSIVRENPVALAALGLFGMLILGLAYGSSNPGDGLHYLLKYVDLLFVPLFLAFFREAKTRERALLAFGLAAVASVIVSHMAYMNLLAHSSLLPRESKLPTGFKASITHGLIVALASYFFALVARAEQNKNYRMGYIALSLFAAHNVVFMGFGRTGYLLVTLLFLYFFAVTYGHRGLVLISAIVLATFLTAYVTSTIFHQRVNAAAQEFSEWELGKPSITSVGERLEYYITSVEIIRTHPLIGTGTGSFPAEYSRAVAGRNMMVTVNPHNEYLMIAVQIGLVGLASLVYLFFRQWQTAGRLVQPLYRDLGRGLVIAFAVGCLFNSLLLDHTEGLLFAWLSALLFSSPAKPTSAPVGPTP
jgi:O-antigen ligase